MIDTKPLKEVFQRELDHLATLRDELRVQAHLAKTEVARELEQLEGRWLHVQDELKRVAEQSPVRAELETKARNVIAEVRSSYERIKQELKM